MMRSRTVARLLVAACALLPAVAGAQGPRSTGLGAIGSVDPNYQVSVNGSAFGNAFVLDRAGSIPGTAVWIGASASGSLAGGAADNNLTRFSYSFRTTFTGGTATGFSYQCALDDVFTSIVLNSVTLSAGCDQYNVGATRTITGLVPGLNTLTFNMGGNGITDGLLVNITALQTSTVPEPATVALMGAGLLALGVVARRKRHEA
jgi:hypothetical protein